MCPTLAFLPLGSPSSLSGITLIGWGLHGSSLAPYRSPHQLPFAHSRWQWSQRRTSLVSTMVPEGWDANKGLQMFVAWTSGPTCKCSGFCFHLWLPVRGNWELILGFPTEGSVVQSSPSCQLSRVVWSVLTSRSHLTRSFKSSRTPRPWGDAASVLVDETQQRAGVGENGERSFLSNSRNGVDTMGATSETPNLYS